MIHRFLAVSLLSLSTLTVAGAQTPTVTSMAWGGVNANVSGAAFTVTGRNLSNLSIAKLVSTETNVEYDLDLASMTATTAVVRLREVSIARPPIPPGVYRLRLGAPGNTALSVGTITVSGLRVADFTASSIQSPLLIDFFGLTGAPSTPQGALLRDEAGNEWRTAQIGQDPNRRQHWMSRWSPVPVGLYDLFLLGNADLPLWKSPTKFRVFANPR